MKNRNWDIVLAEKLIDAGKPLADVAKEVGATYSALYKWNAKRSHGSVPPTLPSVEIQPEPVCSDEVPDIDIPLPDVPAPMPLYGLVSALEKIATATVSSGLISDTEGFRIIHLAGSSSIRGLRLVIEFDVNGNPGVPLIELH